MDYTIRYGLEFNPFLKNSKEIFVSTDESKEVLFRLDYLAKTKGFGLLTGSLFAPFRKPLRWTITT